MILVIHIGYYNFYRFVERRCSNMDLNRDLIFFQFIPGTIFVRTCNAEPVRFGKDHDLATSQKTFGKELFSDTTYCNMSPLGNLMIQNPSNVNDSVIFLVAKRDVKILDLNILSQLFGVQLKSGVKLGNPYTRGLLASCFR